MADIVTGSVTGNLDTTSLMQDHSDIRREAAMANGAAVAAVKDTRYDIATSAHGVATDLAKQIDATTDALTKNIHTVSRDSMDLRAQVTGLGFQIRDGFGYMTKDNEVNSLKSQLEAQKNTQFLSDRIGSEGEKTRAVLESYRGDDLNRRLIERNAELVEERHYGRWARGGWDQAQFAAVSNQMQNFGSQLQETRQGMVNFGTMTGSTQTSSNQAV